MNCGSSIDCALQTMGIAAVMPGRRESVFGQSRRHEGNHGCQLRSIATAVGVVGFICTSLAFCPPLYFRSENASAPARAAGTAGAVMIAAPSENRRSEGPEIQSVVAAAGARTGAAIRVIRMGVRQVSDCRGSSPACGFDQRGEAAVFC
jgi:hypothetical protein